MILSVSRRTDIPAFYSEWFMNRIRDKYVYVRNSFNPNQISNVNISPDVADCIVFWSKNPAPIMKHLKELNEMNYKYYFQFTITPYSNDLEVNLGDKEKIVNTFIKLSEKIGKEKVILRYDPILITDKYNNSFHFEAFEKICEKLNEYTEKVVISFLDNYKKVSRNMKSIDLKEMDMCYIAENFAKIAEKYNIPIETCAEGIELKEYGINHAKCIDGDLIEKIIGCKLNEKDKDKKDGNREHCGCMKCIDIGEYDTCIHNCLYCYANVNKKVAFNNFNSHNPNSKILTGIYDESLVKVRKDIKSFKDNRISLFDK